MGKTGGSLKEKKRVLRAPNAQCRGVECAKNSEYDDNELPVLFAVGIIPNVRRRARRREGALVGDSCL